MTNRWHSIRQALDQRLSQRFRLFAVLTALVIAVAGFLALLQPKISQIREFGILNLQQTRTRLTIKEATLEATKSLAAEYQRINAQDIQTLQAILPKEPDLPAMFVQVEAIALSSGLKLSSVSFSTAQTQTNKKAAKEETEEGVATTGAGKTVSAGTATTPATESAAAKRSGAVREMTTTFTVTGGSGYASLKQFLDTLESSVRLLNVQSLSYTPAKPGDAETYVINATTFYLPQ